MRESEAEWCGRSTSRTPASVCGYRRREDRVARADTAPKRMTVPTSRKPSVAIVGSGFGGISAAIMLRREGYEDVTVFEREQRVGGVWNANTYPGIACDIPSHLYEYSFAPNPNWSRRYSPGAES